VTRDYIFMEKRMIDEEWELLIEIQQPDEAQFIVGLLRSNGIPCDLKREAAALLFGLSVGPLAQSAIYVPASLLGQAELLLMELEKEREIEETGESGD
jgi:hypothetical protein